MGRGGNNRAVHRGSKGYEGHGVRGSNDDRWGTTNPEEDPFRDLRAHEDDLAGPVDDEYVWPVFEEEED